LSLQNIPLSLHNRKLSLHILCITHCTVFYVLPNGLLVRRRRLTNESMASSA